MKDVEWAGEMPQCDVCGGPAPYNTPTRPSSITGGKWGNMCEEHFKLYGIDTSVTERRVPPAGPNLPDEVRAIALRWGGELSPGAAKQVRKGVWRFPEVMDDCDGAIGFVYEVYAPGTPYPCYEDDGRPVGDSTSESWTVRALNDAPDSFWEIEPDGSYRSYRGELEKVW